MLFWEARKVSDTIFTFRDGTNKCTEILGDLGVRQAVRNMPRSML